MGILELPADSRRRPAPPSRRSTTAGGIVGLPSSLPYGHWLIDGYLVGPHAELTDANLTGVNLANVDLTGAWLIRATLVGANLTGSNLTDADMSLADLSDAILTGVIWQGTRCPDGIYRNTPCQ